jgi:hypothetical protein
LAPVARLAWNFPVRGKRCGKPGRKRQRSKHDN